MKISFLVSVSAAQNFDRYYSRSPLLKVLVVIFDPMIP